MASACLPPHLRTTGLAILGTSRGLRPPVWPSGRGRSVRPMGAEHHHRGLHDRPGPVLLIGVVLLRPAGTAPIVPSSWTMTRWRIIGFVVLCVICVGGAVAYLMTTARRRAAPPLGDATTRGDTSADRSTHCSPGPTSSTATPTSARVRAHGRRPPRPPRRSRHHRPDLRAGRLLGGRGICLTVDRGAVTTYGATIFDQDLTTVATLDLLGQPSRTRFSTTVATGR